MRRRFAIAAMMLCALVAGASAAAGADARAVMEKHLATLPSDEQAEVKMDIYRRIGTGDAEPTTPQVSVRYTRAVRGSGADRKIRIDVRNPKSMAGIALIARWDAEKKRHEVIRFLPGRTTLSAVSYLGTEFLQSHLRYEHVVPLALDDYTWASKDAQEIDGTACHVVEAKCKPGRVYSRIVYYIRKDDSKALKVEYCKGETVMMTRAVQSDGSEVWTREKTRERTVLTFSDRETTPPAEDRFERDSLASKPEVVEMMRQRALILEEIDTLERKHKALRAEIEQLKAGQ